jgi:hypothetical protein
MDWLQDLEMLCPKCHEGWLIEDLLVSHASETLVWGLGCTRCKYVMIL